MNTLRIVLLLGVCACTAHAAESPPPAQAASDIKILRGQWNFLNSSTAFCVEKVPAMKAEFDDAREHAEDEMRKAEDTLLQEAADHGDNYKPYFDLYAETWSKYALQLMESLKRRDPHTACPDLLNSWQSSDADLILEDWRGFAQRNGLP